MDAAGTECRGGLDPVTPVTEYTIPLHRLRASTGRGRWRLPSPRRHDAIYYIRRANAWPKRLEDEDDED